MGSAAWPSYDRSGICRSTSAFVVRGSHAHRRHRQQRAIGWRAPRVTGRCHTIVHGQDRRGRSDLIGRAFLRPRGADHTFGREAWRRPGRIRPNRVAWTMWGGFCVCLGHQAQSHHRTRRCRPTDQDLPPARGSAAHLRHLLFNRCVCSARHRQGSAHAIQPSNGGGTPHERPPQTRGQSWGCGADTGRCCGGRGTSSGQRNTPGAECKPTFRGNQ